MKLPKNFFIGASTAAHQVEGNNIHSDFWAMEQMEHSSFDEPSLDAVNHYHQFREDIKLMADAGLNAYRFSIEWARIEPERGKYDETEIAHYKEVLECCHENGIEPIVTMHHFSSPQWLIKQGGWENEATVEAFANYCTYVVEQLGDLMHYICTINEANMGLQIAAIAKRYMIKMREQMATNNGRAEEEKNVQVGINLVTNPMLERVKKQTIENAAVFGVEKPAIFLDVRTPEGDLLIMRAHQAARVAMKKIKPELQIGTTLSLHDIQVTEGGEEQAKNNWEEELLHYLPYIQKDDFFGLQNYTRTLMGPNGPLPAPEGAELTQMEYEYYPKALANAIRKVHDNVSLPIMITENGIGTSDDSRRCAFIKEALEGVKECIAEDIPVIGYLHWSLLDNFEWQKGFSKTFGLIAVDRSTQTRIPKESLKVLGEYTR